jgi:hypothetical protein
MSASETEENPDLPPAPPARPSWEVAAPAAHPAPARPATPPRPAAPMRFAAMTPPTAPAAPPTLSTAPPPAASPSPVFADTIQYDLAGNPIGVSAATPAPSLSPTPYAPSAGAAAWPPPPVAGQALGSLRNTSGELGDVPPEIARLTWNWGAFFFPVLWCRKHGMAAQVNVLRYGLLAIIVLRTVLHSVSPTIFIVLGVVYGVAYSGLRLYYAVKGHTLAWQHRHFTGGVAEYFQVQKAWMWWGIGLSALWTVVIPAAIFFGVLSAVLSGPGHHGLNGTAP